MSMRVPPVLSPTGPPLPLASPPLSVEPAKIPLLETTGKIALLPEPGPTAAWAMLPPEILRIFVELAGKGAVRQVPGVTEGAAHPYLAGDSRFAAEMRAVSHVIRGIDAGTIAVEDFNAFLNVAGVEQGIISRSLTELGLNPENLVLNGALYRLAAGGLVPVRQPPPTGDGLRLQTLLVVVLLGLIAAALIRFS